MKKEDRRQIIDEDSLDNGQGVELDSHPGISEGDPIAAPKFKSENLNEDVQILGLFQVAGSDVKGVRIIVGLGLAIAIVSAIALGIAYGIGAKQVKLTGFVTTDCVPCADMGADILKKGGSAVDAAVTTMLCNGLVNMHASGLGGGGYMMIHDHKQNVSFAVDFNPKASLSATPEKYTNNQELKFGKKAVAVPGELAGLALAHKYYGRLEWKDLVEPVATLAREGFSITEDLKSKIDRTPGLLQYIRMEKNTNIYNMLIDSNTGQGKSAGTIIKRPDFAEALDLIAADPNSFYKSDISLDISESVDGNITSEDLSAYKAVAADVLRMNYSDYILETPGPPAGGLALLHMLKILEGYKFSSDDRDNALTYHRIIEAMKFGFAAYPNIVEFDSSESSANFTSNMLSAGHCEAVRLNITDNTTHEQSFYDPTYTATPTQGTSAVAAADDDELYVSAISSLNGYLGSAIMTKKYGIILNNFMDTFDHEIDPLIPQLPPNPENKVKGGRRPRSPAAPIIFYHRHHKCNKRGAVGATGGQEIITATAQYLLDVLSFGLNNKESVSRPRLHHTLVPNTLHVEEKFSTDTRITLKTKSHEILAPEKALSCVSAGYKDAQQLYSTSDTRKDGKSIIIEK